MEKILENTTEQIKTTMIINFNTNATNALKTQTQNKNKNTQTKIQTTIIRQNKIIKYM